MKPDPEMILTFDEGKVMKETIGFEGKSCTEMTAFIEEALKAKNQKRQFKPEYLRTSKVSNDRLRA